ncbi:MAG: anti-sigma factor [Thermoanaerobaculia bacterium]|nr:anti-sigma factor [Thermoanaerobaculia bacterium]
MSTHGDLLDRIPAYALGALDGEELRELETHLDAGCAECDAELLAATADLERLAETVEPVEPSEVTRGRLLRQVGEERARVGRRGFWRAAATVAALGLIALAGSQHFALRGQLAQLQADREATSLRLAQVREELDAARAEVRSLRLAASIVGSPGRRTVRLAGLDPAPEAAGQTFVDPAGGRAVFYASNLAPAEPGTTYQLWFIADGRPVSAGIFDVDEEGSAVVLVEKTVPADSIDLWAVTIEPAGGVPQPTGAMVLKG